MSENITVTRQSLKALLCDEWVASDKASRYQTQAQETLQELSNVRMDGIAFVLADPAYAALERHELAALGCGA